MNNKSQQVLNQNLGLFKLFIYRLEAINGVKPGNEAKRSVMNALLAEMNDEMAKKSFIDICFFKYDTKL